MCYSFLFFGIHTNQNEAKLVDKYDQRILSCRICYTGHVETSIQATVKCLQCKARKQV